MSKDLTKSDIDRQNILNNPYAIKEIKKATNLRGIKFQGKLTLIKEQVAAFFQVEQRTIDNYLSRYESELKQNGYEILRGKPLQDYKIAISEQFANETDFVGKSLHKITMLGIFDFRAFLNLAMLITESERARLLRQAILDIVIDTINKRTGGATKYINQRDEDFIISYFKEENYRKEFTDALRDYVDMGKFKYPAYTNKIYVSIFKENAREYKKILRLQESDKVRDTFYSEVLDLISSYEYGFAKIIAEAFNKAGRKLTSWEVDKLFVEFESQAHWKPLVENARNKMASRDLALRDAFHLRLPEYITPLETAEFERFLDVKSKELVERLEEAKEVFKRLKERE
ncbi:MAG: DNA-binding protein [candidate division Zixibacteria bacterium]